MIKVKLGKQIDAKTLYQKLLSSAHMMHRGYQVLFKSTFKTNNTVIEMEDGTIVHKPSPSIITGYNFCFYNSPEKTVINVNIFVTNDSADAYYYFSTNHALTAGTDMTEVENEIKQNI